jgi:7,8-dihydroneopterin aldolase/epimerase/oxygenase
MGIIRIEGMEFFAYHGCFKEEQVIGTRFIADVTIETNTSQAEVTDDLKQTINYQVVYKLVKTEMEQKSHLLEHVARRILDSIFTHYTEVQHVNIKIAKLNPALSAGGRVKEVSVTLFR